MHEFRKAYNGGRQAAMKQSSLHLDEEGTGLRGPLRTQLDSPKQKQGFPVGASALSSEGKTSTCGSEKRWVPAGCSRGCE